MGVPKFFRYISERYPCLSDLIYENQVPDIDNLYLDMNGIIHNCSHPNDNDVHFRISEEQIFKDIFNYLEFLFNLMKPQKLFFMAIDGVAPRAKMNQQRGRRFRSAKDAELMEQRARDRGETLPEENRFDSNCITPGTVFMTRLNTALQYFVKKKMSTDERWQHCTVILSGHNTPGEGEHKIMEYIRFLKVQPDYNPETRHCLYGLDADLIMLGLCTHERHFTLLREEVKFGGKQSSVPDVGDKKFYLLHLTLMKEYLEMEFESIKHELKFEFNAENIIDDWIFLIFFIGNDFIPHLPNLHINQNALPIIMDTYKSVLVTLDGYININGKLNLPRLQKFFKKLAEHEKRQFAEQQNNLTIASNINKQSRSTTENTNSNASKDLLDMIKRTEDMYFDDDDSDTIEREFYLHKRNYYSEKLLLKNMTQQMYLNQSRGYIDALQWTLDYYYCGCQSWSWYYPHHYAPFISDLVQFDDHVFNFKLGKPFLPFQQLLSVLPAASRNFLPPPYRKLMTNADSEIIDFYPLNFETDLNGKQQEWEAVVLIPFIDENRLLRAMEKCEKELTIDQRLRNKHGPMLVYNYTSKSYGVTPGPEGFATISNTYCVERQIEQNDILVPHDKLVFGPSKGTNQEIYYLGYPTFKHLEYRTELLKKGVRVFNMSSRYENMIIILNDAYEVEARMFDLIGGTVFVNWPNLTEALVVAVSTKQSIVTRHDTTANNKWHSEVKKITDHYMNRLGIHVGDIKQIVHVRTFNGFEYILKNNRYELTPKWNSNETVFPAQTVLTHIRTHKPQIKSILNVSDILTQNSTVFMKINPYYGSIGVVEKLTGFNEFCQVKVLLSVKDEPEFSKAINVQNELQKRYINSYDAAKELRLMLPVFNRVTGSILIIPGSRRPITQDMAKINIGLQFKMAKNNEEVISYCKKIRNQWHFSRKAIEAIEQYRNAFPRLFTKWGEHINYNDYFFESDFFPEEAGEVRITEVKAWLAAQPFWGAPRKSCDTDMIEPEVVEEVLSSTESSVISSSVLKKVVVRPEALYIPGTKMSAEAIDPDTRFYLFDRVAVAKALTNAPIGAKGTIIGISTMKEANPAKQENVDKKHIYYTVLLDVKINNDPAIYGIKKTHGRVQQFAESTLINLSHGGRDVKHNDEYIIDLTVDDVKSDYQKESKMLAKDTRETNKKLTKDETSAPIRLLPGNENSIANILFKANMANYSNMKTGLLQKQSQTTGKKNDKPNTENMTSIPDQTSDEANNLPVQIFMDYWKQRNDKKSEEATHFVKQILNIRPEEKEKQSKVMPQPFSAPSMQQAPLSINLPKPPISWCNTEKKEDTKQMSADQVVPNINNQQPQISMLPFFDVSQSLKAEYQSPFPPPPVIQPGISSRFYGTFPINHGYRFPVQTVNYDNPMSSSWQNRFKMSKPTPHKPNMYNPRIRLPQPPIDQLKYRLQYNNKYQPQQPVTPKCGSSYQIMKSDLNWRATEAGHGAFVPLQAEIKATKMKQNVFNLSNNFVKMNAQNRSIYEKKLSENQKQFAEFLSQNAAVPPESPTVPIKDAPTDLAQAAEETTPTTANVILESELSVYKPRKSRIAAKFNNI